MNVLIEKFKIDKKYSNLLYHFFKKNLPTSLVSNIGNVLFFKFCKYLEKKSETRYYLLSNKKIISCLIFTKKGHEVINFFRRNSFNILAKLLFSINLYNKYLIINSFFASFYKLNEKFFKNEIVIIATEKKCRSRGSASFLIQYVFKKYRMLNVKSELVSKKFYIKNNFKVVVKKKLGLKTYFFLKKII